MKRLLGKILDRLIYGGGGTWAYSAGKRFMASGRYKQAADAFADAATAFSDRRGRNHQWTTQAQAYRAWCLLQAGEVQQAIDLYEKVADIERGEGGAYHPRTGDVLSQLAEAYDRAGRSADAERVRRQANATEQD